MFANVGLLHEAEKTGTASPMTSNHKATLDAEITRALAEFAALEKLSETGK